MPWLYGGDKGYSTWSIYVTWPIHRWHRLWRRQWIQYMILHHTGHDPASYKAWSCIIHSMILHPTEHDPPSLSDTALRHFLCSWMLFPAFIVRRGQCIQCMILHIFASRRRDWIGRRLGRATASRLLWLRVLLCPLYVWITIVGMPVPEGTDSLVSIHKTISDSHIKRRQCKVQQSIHWSTIKHQHHPFFGLFWGTCLVRLDLSTMRIFGLHQFYQYLWWTFANQLYRYLW